MQTGASPFPAGQVRAGSVVALWRYPVKSMMGEELNSSEVTDRGLLGDRQFAVVDRSSGKAGGREPEEVGQLLRLPGRLCRASGTRSEDFRGPDHASRWDGRDHRAR
jgi:uncharacterized protein YcbX